MVDEMYMKYTNILKNDQPTADVKPLCLQMLNHIWSVFNPSFATAPLDTF